MNIFLRLIVFLVSLAIFICLLGLCKHMSDFIHPFIDSLNDALDEQVGFLGRREFIKTTRKGNISYDFQFLEVFDIEEHYLSPNLLYWHYYLMKCGFTFWTFEGLREMTFFYFRRGRMTIREKANVVMRILLVFCAFPHLPRFSIPHAVWILPPRS
jgi:hypothetical protein